MGKKADHRLVQPKPEDYIERKREDGEIDKLLMGPYTLRQRNQYYKAHISLYMTRHPDSTQKQATRAVFNKWRTMVLATLEYQHKIAHTASNDLLEKEYKGKSK